MSAALPSLKSASGAGFTFEDKVAAFLLCEMLIGRASLGTRFGVIEKLERQAVDWEPFGDLRLVVPNSTGKLVNCGGSVKSNRQISSNGVSGDLCSGLWITMGKGVFLKGNDALVLFCSTLSHDVHQHVQSLCNQAVEIDPARLDQKIVHAEQRKIYDSFCKPNDSSENGLPGHILSHFVLREFDFEDTASSSESDAIRLGREILVPGMATDDNATAVWHELLRIAQTLRTTGGEITREKLAAKLRHKFKLRDDPCDTVEWSHIRNFSDGWVNEIDAALPGGFIIPRSKELLDFRTNLAKGYVLPVLGETGSGKSAAAKIVAAELAKVGTEIIWIKADRFPDMLQMVPNFGAICGRIRKDAGLLVFDAIEGCYEPEAIKVIAQIITQLLSVPETPWQIVLICQTPEWSRVTLNLNKYLPAGLILIEHVEFSELSKEDLTLVCSTYPSVARLSGYPHLQRMLATPKMLDVLLGGQLAENRELASEADLVDWWWEQQVRGTSAITAEERVARQLAVRMADELCTELPPDAVTGSELATDVLVSNRVLRLTRDGRIRFHHDLLADWSRMKHLLSLGDESVEFMRKHAENPPWIRAMRLLSQHLLDRTSDFTRWQNIAGECSTEAASENEPSAESLQVLDAWLEGMVFCNNPGKTIDGQKSDLFKKSGFLLRRFVRRLLHVGTYPDPVIQNEWRERDPQTADAAAILFRWPVLSLWMPVLQFLVNNSNEATEYLPEELAEIGIMWANLEKYLKRPWPVLADLILKNAEKEFRRELAGTYRPDRRTRAKFRGSKTRITIYTAGLRTGSQLPDRCAKLVLKAAGRGLWEEGDLPDTADIEWKGELKEHQGSIFLRLRFTGPSPTSWEQGPRRRTSDDFGEAWLKSGGALDLFKQCPEAACEITLGFLLRWPKFEISRKYYSDLGSEKHGFDSIADRMNFPFWTEGPFVAFFRENWQPTLKMVIDLVNFATDRYCDWWPYEPVSELSFVTAVGEVHWKGNHQVYAWNRYNMNVVNVVSCALMALEKWLDDCLRSGTPVSADIHALFQQGRSLAFGGVLVGLGKRHPTLFLNELRPLLSVRDIYMFDVRAVHDGTAGNSWPQDTKLIKELRREWNGLPGRNTWLLDACCDWYLNKPEFGPVLEEVSAIWREKAKVFDSGSDEQLALLRWAANFDRSYWIETVTPAGKKVWRPNRPAELRDPQAEKEQSLRQVLINTPIQCNEALTKRHTLSDEHAESIWKTINNWAPFEAGLSDQSKDEFESALLDHRHARAGFLAVLLSLGGHWLKKHPEECLSIKTDVWKLLEDPPKILFAGPDDLHDDGEGLLARCAIRCWCGDLKSPEWRTAVARFVMAERYRTVQTLFDEAYYARNDLGSEIQSLQAFALSFTAIRKSIYVRNYGVEQMDMKSLDDWASKWIPAFAKGNGPVWPVSWAAIDSTEPLHNGDGVGSDNEKKTRKGYGLDASLLIAIFGKMPPLAEAADHTERAHWLSISKELLGVFLRTLPSVGGDGSEEWEYQPWSTDEQIFDCVAARIFECTPKEQPELWRPILDLPPAAHHHIEQFLSAILLQSIHTDPPQVTELLRIWKEIIEYLFSKSEWLSRSRGSEDVWQHLFLYGTTFSCFGEEVFIPFIEGLRPWFKRHVTTGLDSAYDQSTFAGFLLSKAGECLLVDAFAWLLPSWEQADNYFWEKASERSSLAALLERAWHGYFAEIRKRPDSLKAFKLLTLKLASQQVPTALEVQALMSAYPAS